MKITVTYTIEDGYVGDNRPQHMTIHTEDYEEDMTIEDIEKQLDDEVREDFQQKVNYVFDSRPIAEQILLALKKGAERE